MYKFLVPLLWAWRTYTPTENDAHGCIHIHQYTAQLETHLSRIRATNGYMVRKKLCSQRTWTTCHNWLSPHHTLNLSQLGSDKESTGGAVATNSNGMSQKRASNCWLPTQSELRCSAWTEGLCSNSLPKSVIWQLAIFFPDWISKSLDSKININFC